MRLTLQPKPSTHRPERENPARKKTQSAPHAALPRFLARPDSSESSGCGECLPLYLRSSSPMGPAPALDSMQPGMATPQHPISKALEDQSPGQALGPSVRADLEPRLGHRLDEVRVHTGPSASSLAKGLGAMAFTRNRDIYFEEGRFQPEHPAGRKLLVHELAHVMQGRAGRASSKAPCCSGCASGKGCEKCGGEKLSQPSDPAEQEAEALAQKIASGKRAEPGDLRAGAPSLARQLPSEAPGMEEAGACLPGYSICDFIHERITMEAQLALSDMYKRGGEDCSLALSMLGAVERGELEGIYIEDQGKPALLGQRHGIGWWNLIPPGKNALVLELESPPMLVLRKRAAAQRSTLPEVLKEAWQTSSLGGRVIVPFPPKPYGCAPPPPPPPPPPPKKIPDPEPTPTEPCPYPRCDTFVPWPTCRRNSYGVPYDCIPIPGERCGICEETPGIQDCFEENERRHQRERQKCKDDYSPEAVFGYIIKECGMDAVECFAKKDIVACLQTVGCFVDPGPLNDHEQCLKEEQRRYDEEVKRCKTIVEPDVG